jgi:hypothetical protein
VRVGEVRLERQRPLVPRRRVIQPVHSHEGNGLIVVRLGIVRLEAHGPLEAGHRVVGFVLDQQDGAEVMMRLGEVRPQRQDPSDQIDRDLVAAPLPCEHTKKIKAVDVTGIDGADLPVEALGLGQSAGLVMREGQGEPLCDLS